MAKWGNKYEKTRWRGVTVDFGTKAFIMDCEKHGGGVFTLYQGSYHDGDLSGGTHLGGGIVDGLRSVATQDKDLRTIKNRGGFGYARGPKLFMYHIHFGPKHWKTASGALNVQYKQYDRGENGLVGGGKDDHPYRSDAEFDYNKFLKELTLWDKFNAAVKDVRHALKRKRKIRRQIERLHGNAN